MLVRAIHVCKGHIEKCVHNVRPQIYQHLGIQLYCLRVVLITLVKQGTGLLGSLFFADTQTLVNREVAAGDKVDDLRPILLMA